MGIPNKVGTYHSADYPYKSTNAVETVEKPVEFVEKSGGFSRKLLVENSFSAG